MGPKVHCRRFVVAALTLGASVLALPEAAAAEGHPLKDSHYIVFELDEDGFATPVFHRRVVLTHPRKAVTEDHLRKARTADPRGEEVLAVRVVADRELVYRDLVPVIRELRGEFHGEPLAAGFEIEHTRHRVQHPTLVVRVPAIPGAELEIEGRHRSAYSLDAIEAGREELKLAAFGERAALVSAVERKSLKAGGSPANRVDLLVMGDGYTSAQSANFTADANALMSAFFSITPYAEYANYVNTSTLFTASTQSGADHPPYNAGCTGDNTACCSDSTAASDPLAGTYVNTAFDARYCSYMIHRLLVVDNSKVLTAAAAAPNWDLIFVIVNDTTYGGSGGAVAVASIHWQSPDVLRHEYGHSFTGLADEYDSAYPGFPACSDVSGPACEPNVTDVSTRAQVKWSPWINPATPVPTPENAGYGSVVGLFEGARYLTSGMYRPRDVNCLMKVLGQGFCEICSQAYVLALYDGGWGVPASGIDPIEPGSESPTVGTVQAAGSVTLSVSLLQPAVGPGMNVSWTVDNVVQVGQSGSSFTFNPPGDGTYQVKITVTDQTSLVDPLMAGSSLTSSRQWTVQVSTLIFADSFESGGMTNWSHSVP